ncbi:probable ATP-dependent RNA helicase DDX28 [Haliotis rubra]|uniref:probable ATP-dependent RNA helicase DDX28 n=1 Tax=Haliotis rubra TaxID=36100 RepID=UPI001EE50D85|nr:probable ATP-dependent RNA helicase DDX28 [Haliotis rubra]
MDRSYLFRVLDQLIRCHRLSSTHIINNSLPRITLPQKMVQKVEKAKERKELLALQKKRRSTFKSPLVISCKREQFNHHKGQTYSGFDPKILASHGWKNKQSAGDHFTLVPYSQNPALKGTTHHPSFTEFELHTGLQKGLHKLGYTEPTHIQAKTIPAVLEGDNVLCAAETGSGKTLAYLLPALEMIHHQKLRYSGDHPPNSPRTIILTPSRELTDQILDVCQRLCEHTDIQPYAICGGRGTKHRLAWGEKAQMDILMATPGVLRKFLGAGLMKPGFLQHVILDEADSLLDDSFSSEVMSILQKLRVTASSGQTAAGHQDGAQFTLVGATIPRGLEEKIGDTIAVNSLHRVTSDHVHYLMPHVPQTFLRLKPSQKAETIVQLARKNHQKGLPTLIFSNRSETSFWLSELLRENAVPNVFMNAAIQEKRLSSLFSRFQSGETDVMVATDIASRGLDLLRVHHVINFDCPPFVSDYIHRAGRVGRVGSHTSGQVTTFITKKWEVDLLWQIETAARKHQALHNVNANIKRKISSIIARKFPHRDVL